MPARNKLRGMSEHGLTIHLFGTCSRVSKHRTLPGMILTPEKLFAFSFHDGTTGQSTSSGAALRMKARTQIGRVTIAVLAINDPEVLNVRRALQDEAVFWSKELIRPAPNAGFGAL